MRIATRLLLAAALAGGTFITASPASACDDPRKCAACHWSTPEEILRGDPLVTCYS